MSEGTKALAVRAAEVLKTPDELVIALTDGIQDDKVITELINQSKDMVVHDETSYNAVKNAATILQSSRTSIEKWIERVKRPFLDVQKGLLALSKPKVEKLEAAEKVLRAKLAAFDKIQQDKEAAALAKVEETYTKRAQWLQSAMGMVFDPVTNLWTVGTATLTNEVVRISSTEVWQKLIVERVKPESDRVKVEAIKAQEALAKLDAERAAPPVSAISQVVDTQMQMNQLEVNVQHQRMQQLKDYNVEELRPGWYGLPDGTHLNLTYYLTTSDEEWESRVMTVLRKYAKPSSNVPLPDPITIPGGTPIALPNITTDPVLNDAKRLEFVIQLMTQANGELNKMQSEIGKHNANHIRVAIDEALRIVTVHVKDAIAMSQGSIKDMQGEGIKRTPIPPVLPELEDLQPLS